MQQDGVEKCNFPPLTKRSKKSLRKYLLLKRDHSSFSAVEPDSFGGRPNECPHPGGQTENRLRRQAPIPEDGGQRTSLRPASGQRQGLRTGTPTVSCSLLVPARPPCKDRLLKAAGQPASVDPACAARVPPDQEGDTSPTSGECRQERVLHLQERKRLFAARSIVVEMLLGRDREGAAALVSCPQPPPPLPPTFDGQ